MPTINDYKKKALNAAGFSGDINTAEYKWLRNVCTPYKSSIPDMWRYALKKFGYNGPLPMAQEKMLKALGHTTGSISNKWYKYWKNTPLQGIDYAYVNQEARNLVSRFTVVPNDTRKGLIDNLISSLKSAGVYSKLDCLYITAAHDAQAANQNWIGNRFNLTPVSSPTFTTDRGYQGNASSSYLTTGFNPGDGGVYNFVRDSAHIGVYSRTDNTSGLALMGAAAAGGSNRAQLYGRNSGNLNSAWINQTATATSFSLTSTLGFIDLQRVDSATTEQYLNSTSLGTRSVASSGVPIKPFFILAMNTNDVPLGFGGYQISEASIGATLSPTEITAKNSAILTYLQAVGAA